MKKLTTLPKMPEDISWGWGRTNTIVEIADIEDDD
jgi:hypothetical protein